MFLVTISLGISGVSAGLFDSITDNQDLNVTDIEINDQGYSTYEINCKITPKKDFNYLEMFVIFYDDDNAVIEKSPLVWNTNEPAKDQIIKVSGTAYVQNQNEKPSRAEVYITDGFDTNPENAIFSQNVTM